MEKPAEFRGWQRSASGNIVEIEPDAGGGLFSETLNLWLRWEDDQTTHVRLLRPYLPDDTPKGYAHRLLTKKRKGVT